MFDWIKNINKEQPEFWKNYVSKFDEKSKRYIILSTKTTGKNPTKDVILSFGALAIINDNIVINDSFEVMLLQYIYLHDNGLSNEFIIKSKLPKLSEFDAMQAFLMFIGNSVLIGHNIHFDVDIINHTLEKYGCGRLKNQALDIEIMHEKLLEISDRKFSLEELCMAYKVPYDDSQSASEDAYSMALLFLKLKSKLGLE